jgi:hypothetical protein
MSNSINAQEFKFSNISSNDFSLNKKSAVTLYQIPNRLVLPTFSIEPLNNIIAPKYTHQAFFCKMEDRIFRNTKKNVKINLGSHTYVNYLEGKHKYY